MPLRESLKEHIPKFLWETINHPEGYIVDNEEFNARWNLNVAQGDQHAVVIRDLLQMLYETLLNDTDGASHLRIDLPAYAATNVKAVLDIVNTRINTVQSTASLALGNANSAVGTANQANNKSDLAVDIAEQAAITANNAVDVANDAKDTAENVQTEFTTIKPELEQAITDANEAVLHLEDVIVGTVFEQVGGTTESGAFLATADGANTFTIPLGKHSPEYDYLELVYKGISLTLDVNYTMDWRTINLLFNLNEGDMLYYRSTKNKMLDGSFENSVRQFIELHGVQQDYGLITTAPIETIDFGGI